MARLPDAYFEGQARLAAELVKGSKGFEALLGFTNYDNADVGINILPRMIESRPELGGVLQGGTYSVWLQENGGTVPYDITFSVGAVPEVSTAWLFAAGALALAMRRRWAR